MASNVEDPGQKSTKSVTLDVDPPAAAAVGNSTSTNASADAENEEGEVERKHVDDELAAMFGGMKKKKKASKKTQFAVDLDNLPARRDFQAPTTIAGDKAKKEEAAAAAAASAAATAEPASPAGVAAAEGMEDGDLNFGELKKKKKKGKSTKLAEFEKELAEAEAAAAAEEEDEEEGGAGDEDEGANGEDVVDRTAEGDLGDNPFAHDAGADAGGAGAGAGINDKPDDQQAWIGSERDYHYSELLGRIFKTLRQHNPALSGDKKKYTIVPPSVQREGSKKTMFANSLDICKRMHREPEHVYSFLFAELGTIGNVDGSQRLIIKGRFQPKQIENVLRKYIVEYVTCKTCKSPNTILSKENRIYFMTCSTCGSTRSVSAIKTGFQAVTGKRSKLRAAA
ncbi:hypothetical protein K437DRAFT_248459 [Tilletiaria anomala UBC 951]|uniref:Translation initiation factor IF2/IF5 domain-containing protein n=1 Tax=Tilletiaria anomala (strain ATCC 24038 / CBS 436.72 / UBC 951) TaxID=1037660 RepID=A0A066VT35_TILAU|nr:uncharacterized protein K437DRAFT_248459 [Tilletiaria anomala UBC 951]KDN43428.1 hypothetical protein K437DRAFT_248459 [Tilletiaria anomala UBC 951]